ncbi:fatty acyl-CoA reductase 3-like [Salvia miltiorrhiza]|uniref:fatty acyl-CoA reductase 3-like n=1 Tax=Salvia miltiorrhiza TaxID=226208 RepID=UPI0025AD6E2F|nr:fatty acyl-CoA reductase 3-like [Salvia miltiorrhiza]
MDKFLHFFENKSILVIGATGFLAKVVIEKIMRVQPEVKKLYLLLRAVDSSSALHRFNTEVMENELFKVVREKYGAKLDSIIKEKVSVVCGDITRDCLGLETSILEEVFGQVDIIINSAATTNFDERYDIALGINTVGAANVLSFAKKCRKLRTLLHVSTAYVCGEKEGLIPETPLKMGEALNMTPGLNIDMEKKIVDDNLRSLHSAPENHIKSMMRELGLQRARKYGWPNTYTFTKAMGEMMLEQFKENIHLIIIRPTIITSTFKQPFPGWTEGVRTIDAFIIGFGTGKLTCYPGNPKITLDLIPVDMVVNAMMVSIATHVYKTTPMIYHVGSSASNPISYLRIRDINTRFFIENPWMSRDGKPVIVTRGTQLPTKLAIQIYINLNYLIPIKILGVVKAASFGYFDRTYIDCSRKVKFLMRMIDLFSPYIFFNIVFDDMNMEKLKSSVNEMCGDIENEIFNFDPKSINWDDYLIHTHIPGLVKYSSKR